MTVAEKINKSEPVSVTLSHTQIDELATRIGASMAVHPPTCSAFSNDEISWFKSCHSAALKTKNVALATTVGFIVLGVLGIVGAGLIAKLQEWTGRIK